MLDTTFARLSAAAAAAAVAEAEHRSTFYIPYWNVPLLRALVPRQRQFAADIKVINECLDQLILLARAQSVQLDEEVLQNRDYTQVWACVDIEDAYTTQACVCGCVCVRGGGPHEGGGETPRLLADLPPNALAYRQSPYPSGPSVPASIYLHQFLTITPSACTRLPLFPCCCLQAVYPLRLDPRSTTLRTSSFLPLLPQTLNPSHHILPPPFFPFIVAALQLADPSLLRFLVDMRGADPDDKQLRDDLMTMLIAGEVWSVCGRGGGWVGGSD